MPCALSSPTSVPPCCHAPLEPRVTQVPDPTLPRPYFSAPPFLPPALRTSFFLPAPAPTSYRRPPPPPRIAPPKCSVLPRYAPPVATLGPTRSRCFLRLFFLCFFSLLVFTLLLFTLILPYFVAARMPSACSSYLCCRHPTQLSRYVPFSSRFAFQPPLHLPTCCITFLPLSPVSTISCSHSSFLRRLLHPLALTFPPTLLTFFSCCPACFPCTCSHHGFTSQHRHFSSHLLVDALPVHP